MEKIDYERLRVKVTKGNVSIFDGDVPYKSIDETFETIRKKVK